MNKILTATTAYNWYDILKKLDYLKKHSSKETYDNLAASEGSMDVVARNMMTYGYQYLVTNNSDDARKAKIEAAGFSFVRQVNGYGIYRIDNSAMER